jgi:hypothetical protein
MYILEKTCGIITTKREFQSVKNAEDMFFIYQDAKNFESIYHEVAYATKTAPNTYTVEIICCWVYRGPNDQILALEPVNNYFNPSTERTVENVKAKTKRDAILATVRPVVYNRG